MGRKIEIKIRNSTAFPLSLVPDHGKVAGAAWEKRDATIPPKGEGSVIANVDANGHYDCSASYKIANGSDDLTLDFGFKGEGSLGGMEEYSGSRSPGYGIGQHWFAVEYGSPKNSNVEAGQATWDVVQYPSSEPPHIQAFDMSANDTSSAVIHKQGDTREGCVEIICDELLGKGNDTIISVEKNVFHFPTEGRTHSNKNLIFTSKEIFDTESFNGVFPRKYTGPDMHYELVIETPKGKKTYNYQTSWRNASPV